MRTLQFFVSPRTVVCWISVPPAKVLPASEFIANLPAGKKLCLAYLDEGSSLTLISQKLAEELGLDQRPRNLTMKTLTGVTKHKSSLIDVNISNMKTGDTYSLTDVYTLT